MMITIEEEHCKMNFDKMKGRNKLEGILLNVKKTWWWIADLSVGEKVSNLHVYLVSHLHVYIYIYLHLYLYLL